MEDSPAMGDSQYSFSLTTFRYGLSDQIIELILVVWFVAIAGAKDSDFDPKHWSRVQESIPVTQLVRETAAVMQEFTQSGGVRPFGVSLLVAGFDDKGPQLYQVDPSGSYFSWKASAMGKNVSNAKAFLEKRYTNDMELDDAVHTAILTLKEGVLTPAEIEDYLQEVE
ncbi:hypothetical protein RJ639_031906 [Escallonia herrerae]|uniref:Proteasome subunit alpha type 2 n=1 Tax=Escallonia herrerae TaxID=1293975 RepID=A0AA88X8S9_9ASTE|nr:hypothetical protein RJ639_031906 [Escallonia herrerae]